MVRDISADHLFARTKAPACPAYPGGSTLPDAARGMSHAWNEEYGALYDRTYRVLCDAGVDEKLADELATERTLAAALKLCGQHGQVSSTEESPATAV